MFGGALPGKPPAEHGSALRGLQLFVVGSAEACSAGALPGEPLAEHGSALQGCSYFFFW